MGLESYGIRPIRMIELLKGGGRLRAKSELPGPKVLNKDVVAGEKTPGLREVKEKGTKHVHID